MPGKSGIEVFEMLKKDDDLKSIPVCVITGKPELRKLIYDRPTTPDGYMDKPITEENLLINIRKILKVHHHQETVESKKQI